MNYYEHHLGDYLRDTAHLSMIEDGAYRRLMDAYYIAEGPFPDDKRELMKVCRAVTKPERDAVDYVLKKFFVYEEGRGWSHNRCEREIARFQAKQAKARASADARWSAQRTQSERNANASDKHDAQHMRTHSERNAPRARPQTPDTRHQHSEPSGSGASPPPDPPPEPPPTDRDAVFANGVTLLTAAGVSDKNARSFLALQCKTHGEAEVRSALARCAEERPIQPIPWLQAALKAAPSAGKAPARKSDALFAANAAAAQRYLERMEGTTS